MAPGLWPGTSRGVVVAHRRRVKATSGRAASKVLTAAPVAEDLLRPAVVKAGGRRRQRVVGYTPRHPAATIAESRCHGRRPGGSSYSDGVREGPPADRKRQDQ